MADRNFDDLVERFEQRIYKTLKGQLRETLIWNHLLECMPALKTGGLSVLDAGGGLGIMASNVLGLQNQVTINDLSANMLDKARNHIAASHPGLLENCVFVHGAIQDFCQNKPQNFDVVLCHALIEWLDDPFWMLTLLSERLKPGGYLSLAFYNRASLVMQNTIKGNIEYLIPGQTGKQAKRKGLSPPNPQFPQQVFDWCQALGFVKLEHIGVRVLTDWLPEGKQTPEQFEKLLAVEQYYARQPPFDLLGRYLHGVWRKPD